MLFETLKHFYLFLGGIYFGLIAGIVQDVNVFVLEIFQKKRILSIILDVIFSLICVFLFYFCLNVVNFGEFRFFMLFSFFVGYFLERKTLGNLVDFIFQKIYNFIRKITLIVLEKFSKIKFKRKNKSAKISKDL